MKRLTLIIALFASLPAHAELSGPWALGSKACTKAKDNLAAAETAKASEREISRLLVLSDCACDERWSFEKPFSRCKPEKKEHEQKYGKENWK